MVGVMSNRGGEEGCFTRPSPVATGGRKAKVCPAHAWPDTVDVVSNLCGKEGYFTQALFCVTGGREAEFCATRSQAGMVNVRSKRCGKECSKHPSFGAAGGREAKFCTTPARVGLTSMNDRERVSQPYFDRVGEHRRTCRDAAHCLTMASDVPHVQEKNRWNDDSVVGESGVTIDEREGRPTNSSDAGPNANDGCCNASFCCSSRAMLSTRWGANSPTTLPVASRQPADPATPDGVSPDGAQPRMKSEIEMTVAPPRGFDGEKKSGELVTAQPSSRDSISDGGSRGTTTHETHESCDRSIASGRNTKRLRRTVQVESIVDVAAGIDETSKEEGGDVKLELDVSAPSPCVSTTSSRPRER
ncbi:unnamed protein product [Sphacelaria rigidula]